MAKELTVLLTGATSGFGRSLVGELLNRGATVIATGRNLTQRTDIFASERSQFGGQLIELDLDVTNASERESVLAQVQSRFERLDVLVNNAGFGIFGPLEDATEDVIRRQMEVNFFSVVFMSQLFLPMLRASHGKILNVSSVFGFLGFPLTSLYCASKFAIEGLSDSLSHELRPHGVQVSLIQPGGYRTNFINSVEWIDRSDSVYGLQIKNYQRLRNQLATRANYQDPIEVGRGMADLCYRRKLPMRVTFGRDAFFSKYFWRLTPSFLFHKITHRTLDKIFLKEIEI